MYASRTLKLHQPAPDITWLIPHAIPRNELVLLDGPAGVGKSCLAAAFVAGISQYGKLAAGETILYVSSPDQRELIMTFLDRHEPNYDHLRDVEYIPDAILVAQKQPWLHHFAEFLQLSMKEHKPALVVIDSLEEILADTPNIEPAEWRKFWNYLRKLASAYNCSFLVPRRQGLHENRQYGPLARIGSEVARFALTLHYHPIDPLSRVITVAKNQLGPIGEQSLAQFHNNTMHMIRLESHQYVRPSRAPATWKSNDTLEEETQEILDVVEAFLDGQPAPKKEVMQHVLSQGYSKRAYLRVMGKSKLTSGKLGTNDWYFIPTIDMYARLMNRRQPAVETNNTPETPDNPPRAPGAAIVDQPKVQPLHPPTETRLAG